MSGPIITTKDATTGEVLYQGRSERLARRAFNNAKATTRVMLLVNDVPWQVAQDPPPVQTPEQRQAKGMYS